MDNPDPAVPASQYLTTAEAALHLDLSPTTLEKYRTVGGGPKFRKFGRLVKYKIADLDAWGDSRTCESTSDDTYTALRRTAL